VDNCLTYHPLVPGGTVYLCYSAVGTNSIRRVRMVFRHNETYGTGAAVSPLVHLMGNGESVSAGDLATHGGVTPFLGSVAFDGHLGGFGAFTQPTVRVTNPTLPQQLLGERLREPNVFEYWLDGPTLQGRVNDWSFWLPYTNAAAFNNVTNLIVQFYAVEGNATTARAPEIMELAAWDTPYPEDLSLPDTAARLGVAADAENGVMQIDVTGSPNVPYVIEATTNLVDWVPLSTNLAVKGRIQFQDPGAALHPRRFYRATHRP
jgi:hypothetical protein